MISDNRVAVGSRNYKKVEIALARLRTQNPNNTIFDSRISKNGITGFKMLGENLGEEKLRQ
jgi:hypothetical protein